MANPAVVVDFVANTKDLQKGFKDAEQSSSGFGSKLKSLGKAGALGAAAAGVAGLTAAVKLGIDEWGEAQKVSAQTGAVLKSTGKAAGVSAKGVEDLAGALMKKSGVDDEAIQSGENVLLTFTNIRNEAGKGKDIFDQTTKAALDMSVALGTDMTSASMTLGKALNDPIKGMSKLTKQGVTFTDAQKKQAEAMVKAGDTAGAQKIILEELQKEFGGSAEAAGKTLPGQINVLKQTFSNFAGEMVGKMIPVLQSLIAWLRDHWPEISAAFQAFWSSVKPILDGLWQLLKTVAEIVIAMWPAIVPIVEGFARTWADVAKIVGAAIKLIVDLIHGDWSKAWEDIKKIVTLAFDGIKSYMLAVPTAIGRVAKEIGGSIWKGIKDGVGDVLGMVKGKIQDAIDAMSGLLDSVYGKAKSVGGKIIGGIADGIGGVWTWMRGKVQDLIDAMQGFLDANTVFSKAKEIGGAILEGVKAGISGLVGAVKASVQGAINAVIDLINKFKIPPVKIAGKTVFKGWGGLNLKHVALAQGGIVTRPTLAMIGEAGPEAVVPLTGAGAGGPFVQVRVFIGDQELTQLVRTEIVDANTGLARTLLAGKAA